MVRYQEATARQLDFESGAPSEAPATAERPRPAPLCVVCGQHPAHLAVAQRRTQRPAKLCLRCHHSVMRQRKMLRVLPSASSGASPFRSGGLSSVDQKPGDLGLIVPRGASLSAEARAAALNHRRRRAQVAARRALALDDCGD